MKCYERRKYSELEEADTLTILDLSLKLPPTFHRGLVGTVQLVQLVLWRVFLQFKVWTLCLVCAIHTLGLACQADT